MIAGMREIRYRGAIDDQYGPESQGRPHSPLPGRRARCHLAGRGRHFSHAGRRLPARPGPAGGGQAQDPRVRAVVEEIATAYDERESHDPIEIGRDVRRRRRRDPSAKVPVVPSPRSGRTVPALDV